MGKEYVWSATTDRILGIGLPLIDIGVRNWALSPSQALAALEQFCAAEIAILGGDVYEMRDGRLHLTHDNWFCDRGPDEEQGAFVLRSVSQARGYITGYARARTSVFFAIVPEL